MHLMLVDAAGEALAVGRLHRLDGHTGQIRYMAVAPAWRGQGLGRRLLAALEARALALGLRRIVLDAREAAAGFYLRHGYRPLGPGHVLFGTIRHVRMEKRLQQEQTQGRHRECRGKHAKADRSLSEDRQARRTA